MTDPGERLASGRAADIYDLGDGKVLRRYRSDQDAGPEADLMRFLADRGYPVPHVHDASGPDLVMDLVPGPTMLEIMARRPWMLPACVRVLAEFQRRLNVIEAPAWLGSDDRIPLGNSVLHLDLHPMNVIMSRHGPVVIDWTNARRGDGEFDGAMTYVLAAGLDRQSLMERAGVPVMLRLFRRHRGRAGIERHLTTAAAYRLADPNITTAEWTNLERLLESA